MESRPPTALHLLPRINLPKGVPSEVLPKNHYLPVRAITRGHYQIVSKLGVRGLSLDDPAWMLGAACTRGLRFILGQSSPPFWGCGLK